MRFNFFVNLPSGVLLQPGFYLMPRFVLVFKTLSPEERVADHHALGDAVEVGGELRVADARAHARDRRKAPRSLPRRRTDRSRHPQIGAIAARIPERGAFRR